MLPTYSIYITIPIILAGYFFYFKNIFYGQTRPNLVSWFLWMLGPFLGVFFQLKAGAGLAVIPIFSAGFGPLVVVVVSLFRKNSVWKISSWDIVCGVLSLLALIFYIFTKDLNIAIIFAILSDFLAFIPTYIKTWKFPESETGILYVASIINNIIALLIITKWSFAIYSFSAYLVAANLALLAVMYRKKLLNKKILS